MSDDKTIVLDDEKAILLDHDYDGIKELDNPLPMWWLFTFFGTIIFGFIYYIHFEFSSPSMRDVLATDMNYYTELKNASGGPARTHSELKGFFPSRSELLLVNLSMMANAPHAMGMKDRV